VSNLRNITDVAITGVDENDAPSTAASNRRHHCWTDENQKKAGRMKESRAIDALSLTTAKGSWSLKDDGDDAFDGSRLSRKCTRMYQRMAASIDHRLS
jgi:hypothetical protein